MAETKQEKFWQANFGREYTKRNIFEPGVLDRLYNDVYGITRSRMNQDFLCGRKVKNILEVGCNIGNQLRLLQEQGHRNLYGIELQTEAVETAKNYTRAINIIQGSVFDLPWRDRYFDLVSTNCVLIHIHPNDLKKTMAEIVRVSKKYIWGFEYFNDKCREIDYRGYRDYLWEDDFCGLFLKNFPKLKLVKRIKFKRSDNNKIDEMFLLKNKH